MSKSFTELNSNVVAVIPVLGRELLIPYTIERINRVVDTVICVVENQQDREICAKAGAVIVNSINKPLGHKWNDGFSAAKDFNPDYVLYVGSSDWVSGNYLEVMLPLAQDHEIVGTLDYHLLHLDYKQIPYKDKKRFTTYKIDDIRANFIGRKLGHWKGYEGEREGEPIGIGRLVRRDFLNRIKWRPFENELHKGLDWSMIKKTESYKGIISEEAQSLAISTTIWANKHSFDTESASNFELIDNVNDYLTKWFPEGLKLF